MARFCGKIGFAMPIEIDPENKPGVWKDQIVERTYYGDLVRDTRRNVQSSTNVNDGISISNQFSIVADPYAMDHLYAMRYLTYRNEKWKISDAVEVQYPRLIISVGSIWNEH